MLIFAENFLITNSIFNMKRLFFLFLAGIATCVSVSAQSEVRGYVISESGEGVPYVAIYLKNRSVGIVSNLEGLYILPGSFLTEKEDTLIFSSVGFASKSIAVSMFNEKILDGSTNVSLLADYVQLTEIVVTPRSRSQKDYGMFHLRSISAIPMFIEGNPSTRLISFVENIEGIDKIIQTVNIAIRSGRSDKTNKLRVFFARKTDDGFRVVNVADEEIFITDFSNSRIRHDVSKYNIPFPKEGIGIGIEWIGEENVAQKRSERIGLAVRTTTATSELHTWIFENDTWVQFPALTEEDINAVPGVFLRAIQKSNARIGITAF